ncbi:MAG: hypothetical protein M3O41_19270 [Pseudomonadota bacterium]|nr:hypothetical protein [Pseudomonadota bacterium]
MKKREVDRVLRAAGRITGEKQFIIIGSQSLHGKYPDLPDSLVQSFEVDLMASKNTDRTEWLNVIGVYSPFHESFGYYADPVDHKTATLPTGWKGRLVTLPVGDTDGVQGLCLDPHDLAIAKYVARREKDIVFTRELAKRGIVSRERLLALLDQTSISEEARGRIHTHIANDFGVQNELDVDRTEDTGSRATIMTTLLQTMTAERAARTERQRLTVRDELRSALRDVLPGVPVTVFGSLTQAGRFTDVSDVDLALAAEPQGLSVYQLIAQLSERLGRRVDVLLLSESRFREKILREGETWTP